MERVGAGRSHLLSNYSIRYVIQAVITALLIINGENPCAINGYNP
jgi:hypothetical protein